VAPSQLPKTVPLLQQHLPRHLVLPGMRDLVQSGMMTLQ
jgi:hypothetical protein